MEVFTLNGAWVLDIPGSTFPRVSATVPGSVYHDLLTAGQIPDPFYRDNENEALKIMDNDFVYSRSFTVPASLLENDAVVLHCDGLDTLATVTVNGTVVGTALRFLSSFIVGATVWAAYMPEEFLGLPMTNEWVYSFLYNMTWALPDAILCVIAFALLQKPLRKYLTCADLRNA